MKNNFPLFAICLFCSSLLGAQKPSLAFSDSTISKLLDSLPNCIRLEFVGDANIQQSITSGTAGLPTNTGMGVILTQEFRSSTQAFKNYNIRELRVQLGINIASTVDTLEAVWKNDIVTNSRDFGTYVMLPLNSRQAASITFKILGEGADNPDWRPWNLCKCRPGKEKFFWSRCKQLCKDPTELAEQAIKKPFWGFFNGIQGSLFASNRALKMSDTFSIHASVLAIHLGLLHEFIPFRLRHEKQLSLYMGTDFVYRRLAGDLGQNDVDDTALRKEIFRSSRRHFYGFGLFGGVQLKNVSAEFNIPVLFTRREPDGSGRKPIPGLNGIQLVTRIRFVGGVPLYDFGR